jgi:hypothetical protein
MFDVKKAFDAEFKLGVCLKFGMCSVQLVAKSFLFKGYRIRVKLVADESE